MKKIFLFLLVMMPVLSFSQRFTYSVDTVDLKMNQKLSFRPNEVTITPNLYGGIDEVVIKKVTVSIVRKRRPVATRTFYRTNQLAIYSVGRLNNNDRVLIQIREVEVKKGGKSKVIKLSNSYFGFEFDPLNGWN